MDTDDRQLLLAMRRGDEKSARLLWQRHAPRLLIHARAILRDPSGAEDAVQTVMCRLLELPRSRLAAINDASSYLAAAVRREALNQLRLARREAARHSTSRAGPDAEPGVHAMAGDLSGALQILPRRLREIVVLKHMSGLTFDQIALALGLNRNTTAGRYRAAIAALRDIMDSAAIAQGACDD